MFKETTALKKLLTLRKRLRVVQGGTSAGKTIGILLIFIDRLQSKKGLISSVVSETMPHLKRGAIRDFLSIMEGNGYYKDDNWNRTDFIYTFENGSRLEFFSADSSDKVRGPRRNGDLFMNECNNISYDTYTQLVIRTSGNIWLDYNPVQSFWVNDEILPNVDHDFLKLTYLDNEGLDPAIVQEIESRKSNKYFWTVFGLGEMGEIEGKIFNNWQIIDSVPHEARLERYGLDFGYTNDPSAIVAVYYYNGGYIWDEILFAKGFSNKQLAETILAQQRKAMVIADSAEPKSIDEIRSYGVNIQPCVKGRDSVRQRIQLTQDQPHSITKQSVNVIKEYRNYMWATDKDGKRLNEPQHIFSHSMDAGMYAESSLIPMIQRRDFIANLPKRYEDEPANPAR